MALTACGSVGRQSHTGADRDISVEFSAVAGGDAVRCGRPIAGLGSTQAKADLRDLRFYVSEVALIDARGEAVPLRLSLNDWQTASVALVDLADGTGACGPTNATTNNRLVGRAPAGNYRGLRFTVGVPHALNHSDYATAAIPLDVQAMAWSWQAGRKFMQIEIDPAGGVARTAGAPGRSFFLHLGATGCKGNPVTGQTVACERPNRMDVKLDAFDTQRQRVTLDLAALYAGSNIQRDGGGPLGCMSAPEDPECAAMFSALGIEQATGRSVDAGSRQTIFRAAPL